MSVQNELTFQLIVESSPSAMILVNKEAKIAYINVQIEKLFGYSKTELIGQPIEILIPPRFAAADPQLKNMFLASSHPRAMEAGSELYGLKKNGNEFPIEIGLNQLVTVDGTWVIASIIDITERKKLEEQKILFVSIVNSSNDAIISKTLNGIITSWNRGAEKVFGYSAAEIIGKHISTLIPSHLQNEEANIIKKIVGGERVEHYETERIRKNGRLIYVSLTISPIVDAQGQIVGASKICRDITQRKKDEEKLIKANRLYAFISQINQSIIPIKDRQSLFDTACDIALELGKFNFAWIGMIDEIAGKVNLVAHSGIAPDAFAIYDNLYYKNPDFFLTPLERAITTGEYAVSNDVNNDHKMVSFKDHARARGYNSVIILPLKLSGKPIGVFCCASSIINFFDKEEIALLVEVAGDISVALDNFIRAEKQKETEDLVITNEKKFRAIIEKSTDIKTLSTKDGTFLYGSPSVKTVLGYTEEEFLNKLPANLIHPDAIPNYKELRDEILKTPGASFFFHHQLQHKNGSWVWCEGTTTNLLNEEGINALVCNFSDITNRKKEAQQLIKANRRYAFISNINQSIVHIKDKQTFFNKVCKIAKEFGGFKYAWIGLLIENTDCVTLVAQSGIAAADLPSYEDLNYKSPMLISSPIGRAIATESYAYSNDMLNDAGLKDLKELIEKSGARSNICVPLRQGGKMVGIICCKSNLVNFFEREDIDLLVQAAGDISFALDNYEKEENRLLHEKQLEQSELSLKEAQALANIGSWEWTFATGIIVWSEEQCRIFGLEADQAVHSKEEFLTFTHPEDLAFVKEELERVLLSLEEISINYRIVRRNGVVRYVCVTSRFRLDNTGKPISIYGITHDITDKKLAEIELKESEMRLLEYFESAPEAIFILDINSALFVKYNTNAVKLLKFSGEELLKMGPREISPEFQPDGSRTDAKAKEANLKALNSESPVFEWLLMDATGTEIICEIRLVALTQSKEPQILASFIDIRERKKAELELVLNNVELKKTNSELDRFVYSISHELRMPLTSIMGLQQLIKKDLLDERSKGILELIKKSAFGMDEVLREILDYSKNTRVEIKTISIDLATLIDSAFENSNFYQEGFNFDKRVIIKTTTHFCSDVARIKIVVNNLVSNALKYSKKDITDAFIEINVVVDEIKMVMEISDNGIGIKEEYLPNVFKMFYRATTAVSGSGLGLYIIKESVEKLGGNITVESKFGEGTKFRVEIPNTDLTCIDDN